MDRRDFIKKTAVAAATTAMATPAMAMLTKVDSAGRVEGEGELVQEASRPDGRTPKVLLVNGSPRRDGNTCCCLQEIEKQLQKYGMLTEIVQIGAKPIRMCVNCDLPLSIGIYQSVLLMQTAKGAIGFHLLYGVVHHLQQVFLPFLHQHTDLPMSEGLIQKRSGESGV